MARIAPQTAENPSRLKKYTEDTKDNIAIVERNNNKQKDMLSTSLNMNSSKPQNGAHSIKNRIRMAK